MRSARKMIQIAMGFCLVFLVFADAHSQKTDRFRKSFSVPPDKILYVDIDIDAAEVNLKKSSHEYQAEVSAIYSVDEFKILTDYEERRSRLSIRFDKKGWSERSSDETADLWVELPTNVKIDLRAKVKAGEVDIDFGGLALQALDFTTWAGEVVIDFSEPNKTQLEDLRINTKIGETDLVRLGNARFKRAEINGGIGEMSIDLDGTLLPESRAEIDLDIGETQISLPRRSGIKLDVSKFLFLSEIQVPRDMRKSGRYYYSKNYEQAQEILDLDISPGLGELRIR